MKDDVLMQAYEFMDALRKKLDGKIHSIFMSVDAETEGLTLGVGFYYSKGDLTNVQIKISPGERVLESAEAYIEGRAREINQQMTKFRNEADAEPGPVNSWRDLGDDFW